MINTFQIAGVEYNYTVSGKTVTMGREDGAIAKFHDDENYIEEWEDAVMNMVADDNVAWAICNRSEDEV